MVSADASETNSRLTAQFPIGASLTLEGLIRDPYPAYRQLRRHEPVSWIPALNQWFVTRYDDVQAVLSDDERFSNASPNSVVAATFGDQMLSLDGPEHRRQRGAFQALFMPAAARDASSIVAACAGRLVKALGESELTDLRPAFAARLPILVMLELVGLPATLESEVRRYYDQFEAVLSDPHWRGDPAAEVTKQTAAMQARFSVVADSLEIGDLTKDEIERNMLLIFFGGISTVEALLLDSLHALLSDPCLIARTRADRSWDALVDETMRWAGPVQSATRHAATEVTVAGVRIPAGDTVNCMLASANRDGSVFADPDRFDPTRPDLRRHVGFATGGHHCLGRYLAKAEVRIALETLFDAFPGLAFAGNPPAVEGHEFRQPRSLVCRLGVVERA